MNKQMQIMPGQKFVLDIFSALYILLAVWWY